MIQACFPGLPAHQQSLSSAPSGRDTQSSGYSLVEVLIVVAIIVTILGIAIPIYITAIDVARVTRAIGDIRTLEKEITLYSLSNRKLPGSLDDLERGQLVDPWGNVYQYLNFGNAKGKGAFRKDRFLVPLNSDYDLYSMGKDGNSQPALTAQSSQDDIVRAGDGSYVGLGSGF
jgi:general secretion pathway protein G